MTEKTIKPVAALAKEAIASDAEGLKALMRAAFQEVLEAEMTEALGAGKSERTGRRLGYRSGYYERDLITRIGKIELRVPQDRNGRFSTELIERYARAEKALLAALCEMYVQGVSTRKVKAITEELVGHSFSASSISSIVKRLDGELERFMRRQLAEPFAYLIVDARYEKVRVDHVIRDQAVMIAIGVGWDGRRQVLGIEVAHRESAPSWSAFLRGLKERGLHGVRGVGGVGRPRGLDEGNSRDADGVPLAALLCALPAQCARSSTEEGRRGVPAGGQVDIRPALAARRPRATLRRGSRSGAAATPSLSTGWRRTSSRRSPTSCCPPRTAST